MSVCRVGVKEKIGKASVRLFRPYILGSRKVVNK